jgi:hypothetical protein
MEIPQEQIDELKAIAPSVSLSTEGNFSYLLIENLTLPDGCVPSVTDVLLCPMPREGYQSRIFYPSIISGCPTRNWNASNVRILSRNWFAFSWTIPPGLTLSETLLFHLNALRHDKK